MSARTVHLITFSEKLAPYSVSNFDSKHIELPACVHFCAVEPRPDTDVRRVNFCSAQIRFTEVCAASQVAVAHVRVPKIRVLKIRLAQICSQ